VEALLRWQNKRLGLLRPAAFMPLAIASGNLGPIDRWVIASAKQQWQAWREHGDPLGIAVNIAAPELAAPRTMAEILAMLRPLDADALTFELQPASFRDYPALLLAVQRFAAAGARIALDGVTLADAPSRALAGALDEIKISRLLVARAVADFDARTDLRALIELARDYKLSVVAVGVEDEAARDLVASLGCDLAQGYWVSKPLVPDRLASWRRGALGLAFGGAIALAAGFGSGKAAAPGGASAAATATTRGFLPSCCAMDLPSIHPDAASPESGLGTLEQRTGLAFVRETADRVDIFVEASASSALRSQIARAVDRDMSALKEAFAQDFTARPTVYAFATRTSFALGLQQLFGVRGTDAGLLAAANGGVTLPRQNAVVINLENVPNDRDLAILHHELTHALVHQMIGTGSLPAWFDEGLAMLEERRPSADEAAGVRNAAIALTAVSLGRATLADLDSPAQWVQRNAELDGQAYTVAAEAVRLIEQRVGRAGIVRTLGAVSSGQTFAAAYASEAGESLSQFQRAFPARLAEDQAAARILQGPAEGGVLWTLAGFTPGRSVTITIDSADYHLEYAVTPDRYGMYQAAFGSTAPHGEYTLRARTATATAAAILRT
jgi:EAL domain-containing protein (putative c-di-GMP-specific phosphodiesterase class I)